MSIVFVISAPSGAGKSTLANAVLASVDGIEFATSVTTRPPRASEVFGHLYGTPASAVHCARARDNDLLLDIDVQGASSLVDKLPQAVRIFILPPSATQLEQRLRQRSSDEDMVIERRLSEASREVGEYRFYDYVVINSELEASVERLKAILLAERSKRARMKGEMTPILNDFGILPDAATETGE